MNNGASIITPSWNNLPYLKFMIESIRKNSVYDHQIIVHVQEGSDGTIQWLEEQGIEYTHTPQNVGICSGFNMAATKASREWLCLTDDDMYYFPGWDKALFDFYVENEMPELSWISGTIVEHRPSSFPSFIIRDYGNSIETFRESDALRDYESFKHKFNWIHNGSMPVMVKKKFFDEVGGYDTDFDPSPGSEEGFCMRLYQLGCRNFVSVKDCVAYHFASLTNRKPNNMVKKDSNRTFHEKYGMVIREFNQMIGKDTPWHKQENEISIFKHNG